MEICQIIFCKYATKTKRNWSKHNSNAIRCTFRSVVWRQKREEKRYECTSKLLVPSEKMISAVSCQLFDACSSSGWSFLFLLVFIWFRCVFFSGKYCGSGNKNHYNCCTLVILSCVCNFCLFIATLCSQFAAMPFSPHFFRCLLKQLFILPLPFALANITQCKHSIRSSFFCHLFFSNVEYAGIFTQETKFNHLSHQTISRYQKIPHKNAN